MFFIINCIFYVQVHDSLINATLTVDLSNEIDSPITI